MDLVGPACPVAMIGHSIGEYVAACLADVFLSGRRADAGGLRAARLMQELPAGAMLSVRLPASELEVMARGLIMLLTLAAVNGPAPVCRGWADRRGLAALQREFEAAQVAKSSQLNTSHAFHSPMMDPIIEPFAERTRSVRLSPPCIPFVSTVTAEWITPACVRSPVLGTAPSTDGTFCRWGADAVAEGAPPAIVGWPSDDHGHPGPSAGLRPADADRRILPGGHGRGRGRMDRDASGRGPALACR